MGGQGARGAQARLNRRGRKAEEVRAGAGQTLPLCPMPFSPVQSARKFCRGRDGKVGGGVERQAQGARASASGQSTQGSGSESRGVDKGRQGSGEGITEGTAQATRPARVRGGVAADQADLGRLRHDVSAQGHLDATGRRAADGHVEEDNRGAHGGGVAPATRGVGRAVGRAPRWAGDML